MMKKNGEAHTSCYDIWNRKIPARDCKVLKLLKCDAYGDHSERKENKVAKTGEVLTCHRVNLFNEGYPSKKTQFSYPEDMEKELERMKEISNLKDKSTKDKSYENKPYEQNRFRDGRRRIDVVLVAADDGKKDLDTVRTQYLQSILKTGLDVETEPGILPRHKRLVFIKIHAPDTILNEYINVFASKKYFRDNHLRFVQHNVTTVGKIFKCTRISHEREFISSIRDQYQEKLRLSSQERSLIVYKILLELPFGEHANNFGLKRLLSNKVFLDAYALHDGPYFISPNQDWTTINARQILFCNWIGIRNSIKVHPLNLIREYFGEKIGMYFAFYEFYNHALLIAALFGLVYFIASWFTPTDNVFVKDICENKNNTYICPRCKVYEACRFIKLTDLCYLAQLHRVLDSPVTLGYAILLVLWATTFYALWKRKESFWIWLWEINTDRTKEIFRPEYSMYHKAKPRSLRTGIMQHYNCGFRSYVRTFLVSTLSQIFVVGLIALLIPLFMFKSWSDRITIDTKYIPLNWEEIILILTFAIELVFFVQILGEFILRIPVYFLNKWENHRTYESYIRGFSFKTFMGSFLLTFPIMFFYAWVKGIDYFLPGRISDMRVKAWTSYRGYISFTHCGPFTCLDEVFFVLIATILIRHVAIPALVNLFRCVFNARTDYNQGKNITKNIPPWEREYRLQPVTEESMARRHNVLAMQFALVTLLGAVFPLAPLLVLIANLCHIKYEARMFLLSRRRPLLLAGAGLGIWTDVLKFLSFLSATTNALTLARSTKTAIRIVYMMKLGSMKGFLFYYIYKIPIESMLSSQPIDSVKEGDNQIPRFTSQTMTAFDDSFGYSQDMDAYLNYQNICLNQIQDEPLTYSEKKTKQALKKKVVKRKTADIGLNSYVIRKVQKGKRLIKITISNLELNHESDEVAVQYVVEDNYDELLNATEGLIDRIVKKLGGVSY